ncbi:MAG: calcium/sodium antiporter [Mariprofundaceae bacterium]|nr:calcium/sodium antiporter [Mariprofundaceae bacterium]
MMVAVDILAMLVGFFFLVWGSDRFVIGAAVAARQLGISSFIIGLTVVAFCTSMPEILVSVTAVLSDNSGMAIGNALGSNIANIALVLGVSAIMYPMIVHRNILKREMPILFIIMLLLLGLMYDGSITRLDGGLLLLAMFLTFSWLIYLAKKKPIAALKPEEVDTDNISMGHAAWLFVLGLVVLMMGAKIVVWGSVNIAQLLGVSDLVIGLTIVALGTSLPELAASIASVRKGESDMALGNIIGSNLFNMVAVLGIPALIAPLYVGAEVLYRDYSFMVVLTVLLVLMAIGRGDHGTIYRWKGVVLFVLYLCYQVFLYVSA